MTFEINEELAELLRRAGLHPADQEPSAYLLYPMSNDELHQRLHNTSLTPKEVGQLRLGLAVAGLLQG